MNVKWNQATNPIRFTAYDKREKKYLGIKKLHLAEDGTISLMEVEEDGMTLLKGFSDICDVDLRFIISRLESLELEKVIDDCVSHRDIPDAVRDFVRSLLKVQ